MPAVMFRDLLHSLFTQSNFTYAIYLRQKSIRVRYRNPDARVQYCRSITITTSATATNITSPSTAAAAAIIIRLLLLLSLLTLLLLLRELATRKPETKNALATMISFRVEMKMHNNK